MKIKIKKQVGSSELSFEIEEKEIFDTLFNAGFLTSIPTRCSECNSEKVELQSNKAKEYKYVKVICKECFAQANLGQYKDGSGYFWKNFEKWQKQENKEINGDDLDDILN